MSNKTIAELLEISPPMVDDHRKDLLAKIEVNHNAEAIRLELESSRAFDLGDQDDWLAPCLTDATSSVAGRRPWLWR
jgi:hypothetical protein